MRRGELAVQPSTLACSMLYIHTPGGPVRERIRHMPRNRFLVDNMITLVHDFERFTVGFGKSAGVILASEIGDKTFFIAAVRDCLVSLKASHHIGRQD